MLYRQTLRLAYKNNNTINNNVMRYGIVSWSFVICRQTQSENNNCHLFIERFFSHNHPPRYTTTATIVQRSIIRLLSRSSSSSVASKYQREFLSSSGLKKKRKLLLSHYTLRSGPGRNRFLSSTISSTQQRNHFEQTCVSFFEEHHHHHNHHSCFVLSRLLHHRQLFFTTTSSSHYKKNASYLIHIIKTSNNKKLVMMDPLIVKHDNNHQEEEDRIIIGGENDNTKSYKETIRALNTLQYVNTLEKVAEVEKLIRMRQYIECIRMTVEDQDRLSVIHIAGTKGKGSTCSYVESILRHKGYKTGFFSSPHLKEVRERIRINGTLISQETFVKYFWYCFNHIKAEFGDTAPSYFQILTVISFYAFWKEKVDVCIIEVGLGGRYDCTNIVRNPVVCGITHLGFDHTHILGNTIECIAGHKSGIFKAGTTAVTSPQVEGALRVLQENASEVKCGLYMAPNLSAYKELKEDSEIKGYEQFQQENLSLALQLSRIWLQNYNKDLNQRKWVETFSGPTIPVLEPLIPDADIIIPALKSTYWAGRLQIIKRKNITYYLDGAHTINSIRLCSDWFKKKSAAETKDLPSNIKVVKILYFNLTGERNPHKMMIHLKDCGFDFAVFSPNLCYTDEIVEDQHKKEFTLDVTCNNQKEWLELHNKITNHCNEEEADICCHRSSSSVQVQNSKDSPTETFDSVYEALVWCNKGSDNDLCSKRTLDIKDIPSGLKEADHIQVLITGSVHLVGSVFTVFNCSV